MFGSSGWLCGSRHRCRSVILRSISCWSSSNSSSSGSVKCICIVGSCGPCSLCSLGVSLLCVFLFCLFPLFSVRCLSWFVAFFLVMFVLYSHVFLLFWWWLALFVRFAVFFHILGDVCVFCSSGGYLVFSFSGVWFSVSRVRSFIWEVCDECFLNLYLLGHYYISPIEAGF